MGHRRNKNFQEAPYPYYSYKGEWVYYYYPETLSTNRLYEPQVKFNYLDNTAYIQIKGITFNPLWLEESRKSIVRNMKKLLGVKKCIGVLDTSYSKKRKEYTNIFQFHCILPSPPTEGVLKKIEGVCTTYIEEED